MNWCWLLDRGLARAWGLEFDLIQTPSPRQTCSILAVTSGVICMVRPHSRLVWPG